MNAMDIPVYRQNILTHGNGVITPHMKLKKFVNEVTVIETAASLKHRPIRSGTDRCGDDRCHELRTTNVSSIPIPKSRKGAARFKLMNSTPI